jgi:hypothetical protein
VQVKKKIPIDITDDESLRPLGQSGVRIARE